MTMYTIDARIQHYEGEWAKVTEVPTFFLGASTQGIVDEAHAAKIAMEIIMPIPNPKATIFITAVKWEVNP